MDLNLESSDFSLQQINVPVLHKGQHIPINCIK